MEHREDGAGKNQKQTKNKPKTNQKQTKNKPKTKKCPFCSNEKEEKVQPGSVVRLKIGIWGMDVEYERGESLQLRTSGFYQGISNFGTTEHIRN
jgi:hypothetical protein